MRRHRLVSRLAVVPALAALAALVVAFVPAPAPANAAGGCPVPLDRNGNCPIEKGVPVPGTSLPRHPGTTGHGPDGTSPTGTDPTPNYYCVWFPYPDQGSWRNQPIMQGAPPDAVFGEYHCFLNGLPLYGPYVPRWIAPNQVLGQAPAPPTPAEVAQAGLVKVRDLLKKPDIVTDPPDPAASIVDIPTFVSVPNWQGRLQQSNCELNVCVQLTAEPKLTF